MNKISTWFSENKLAASFGGGFLICALAVGWLASASWDDYAVSSQAYSDAVGKLNKLNHQNPFPNESNLSALRSSVSRQQTALDQLTKSLRSFKIAEMPAIADAKPQDKPLKFQDALRAEVTKLKTLSSEKGSGLPQGFYLGFEEYESKLPTPDDVTTLSKQLSAMAWVAENLAGKSGLIVGDFSRVQATNSVKLESPKKPTPAAPSPSQSKGKTILEPIGSFWVSFRCDQSSFREFLKSLTIAPYFLIPAELQLKNSVTEPPKRDAGNDQASAAPQDPQAAQHLPIVVGREQVNVTMKIRIMEYPESAEAKPSAPASKPSAK